MKEEKEEVREEEKKMIKDRFKIYKKKADIEYSTSAFLIYIVYCFIKRAFPIDSFPSRILMKYIPCGEPEISISDSLVPL